jgi:hypothetical protein
MVVESIEIARRPEDVFAYVSQVDRHPEWQDNLLLGKLIAPLAHRDAAKRVPEYQARLKELLERGG